MNQTQRNFLIEKVKKESQAKIAMLEKSLPEAPSLSNYLFHAVMSGTFEIADNETIRGIIKDKALSAKSQKDWMNSKAAGWGSNPNEIAFRATEFFKTPKEFEVRFKEYKEKKDEVEKQIELIKAQTDTLVVRIQLASNSTLQRMINEVDNMGDLSLMDTKLKLLK